MRIVHLFVLLSLVFGASAWGQTYSGTFQAASGGVTYTLKLTQDDQGRLAGSLNNAAGLDLKLEGAVVEDAVSGSGYQGEKIAACFEGGFDDGKLLLVLALLDDKGIPDFDDARNLSFTRKSEGGRAPSPRESPPTEEPPARVPAAGQIGDPSWGFKFDPPRGWRARSDAKGALLGHDTIAGAILVLPHSVRTRDELRQQMLEGLQEENTQLSLEDSLKSPADNRLTGSYTGMYEGSPVKAHGIGALSPYGGGAYIIAVAAPASYTARLAAAADAVAAALRYEKPRTAEVAQHFVGTWFNSTRSTATKMTFNADGTFYEIGESSYSSGAGTDEAWGTAGGNRTAGRWSVRGNREAGVITLSYESGSSRDVNYQVHVENGQTYWNEYYFAGDLYGKE
jgi:hypothetical protein